MTLISKFIASYFSNTATILETRCMEDEYEMVAYYLIKQPNQHLPSVIELKDIPARDTVEISLFDSTNADASVYAVYVSNDVDSTWSKFVQSYTEMDKDDPFVIKIRKAKKHKDNILSLYSLAFYLKHLEQISIMSLLSIFDNYFSLGNFVFECQNSEETISLITDRLAFVQRNITPTFPDRDNNEVTAKILVKAKTLCCNDIIKTHILPSDIYSKNIIGDYSSQFAKILNKVALIYSLCFIADYVSLNDNKLSFKINGYKIVSGTLDISSIDITSVDKWIQIYEWIYHGGNTNDKISIARNIISLNVSNENILFLSDNVQEAINSNYRIYEKENVKQYINLRNNVSEQLRKYQKDIVATVDSFDGDFKKIIFTFLTFVFTSVLIRVLAKNVTDTILLPDTIIILLILYCLVSVFYYFYARWELDNKLKFFDEQYNRTRGLYKEILSESEMSELFLDEKKNGTYVAFQKERKTRFRRVWLGSVAIVVMGLLIILIFNHIQPLYEIKNVLSNICEQLIVLCNDMIVTVERCN